MKRDAYWSKPKKAKCATGDAWWYADKGSIHVHISRPGGGIADAKINRKDLLEYIKRSRPQNGEAK